MHAVASNSTFQWTVKLQTRPGQILAHAIGGERCEKSWCLPSMAGRSPYCEVVKRWQKSLLVKWCASFVLQMKLCLLHLEKACFMSLWRFLSRQIAVLFYLTLGDTRAQSNKKIAPCSQLSFDSEDAKLWIQTIEVHIEASFVKPNIAVIYNQDSSWFAKVDMQDCSIYLPLPSSYVSSLPYSTVQMGKGLNK